MCQFKSAIVSRTGRLYHSEWTDSHEEIITLFNIHDQREGNICRVEFRPTDVTDLDKPEKYKLRIDEERTPDWFTKEKQEKCSEELRKVVKGMIIDSPVCLLYGGAYILAKGASVEVANHSRIVVIRGGTVNAIWGGTVNAICGGTVNAIWGGTVNAIWGGTVNAICGGTVNDIRGGTVNAIRGGTVNDIRGGTVNAICGGTVNAIRGGTVNAIKPEATIVKDHRKK